MTMGRGVTTVVGMSNAQTTAAGTTTRYYSLRDFRDMDHDTLYHLGRRDLSEGDSMALLYADNMRVIGDDKFDLMRRQLAVRDMWLLEDEGTYTVCSGPLVISVG